MLKSIIFGSALLLASTFGVFAAAPTHVVPQHTAPHVAPHAVPYPNGGHPGFGWHGNPDHHHGWWHGRECWLWIGPVCIG